jgi:hypothetical protein
MFFLFKNWQHCLAAGRSPTAEDGYYFILINQLFRFLSKGGPVRSAIFNNRLNLLA